MFLLAIIPSRFQSTLQFWKLELLGSRDFRTSFLFAKDFFFPTTSGMKTTFTFFLGQDLACHKMNIIMPKGRWTHKSASKISDWTEQDLFSFLLRTFFFFENEDFENQRWHGTRGLQATERACPKRERSCLQQKVPKTTPYLYISWLLTYPKDFWVLPNY